MSVLRYVIPAMLACLLVACASPPPSGGPSCTTAYQCEVEGYLKYAA